MKPVISLLLAGALSLSVIAHATPPAIPPVHLLFSDARDIADPWGKIHFGVTPFQLLGNDGNPGFRILYSAPRPDGTWDVYGQSPLKQLGDRISTWKLIHATTRDGLHYENTEEVFTSPAASWTDNISMAYNPDAREFLFLTLKTGDSGFAYTAFFSPDGRQWKEYSKPLFYDGDALSVFWSPVLHRFISISKSLQPYRKRYVDHGGTTPSLHDPSFHDRRVLMIRSSPDGRRWLPDVGITDLRNKAGSKQGIPDRFLTTPDANDPPDIEFYSGVGFWYGDRAFMAVQNYAASPIMPHTHGPHLDSEMWFSRDGLAWQRPWRDTPVLGEASLKMPRLEGKPLIINGMILFPAYGCIAGVKEDRLSYIAARSNAEFSTHPFVMPDTDLFLNAAIPAPDRTFLPEQAYVMASVLDEQGKVIPGFEAGKCILTNADAINLPLRWKDASPRTLAGRKIQLRFTFRSADIYAVTSGK